MPNDNDNANAPNPNPNPNPHVAQREVSCSATNGGVTVSSTCSTGTIGDVKACVTLVKESVGL